MTKKLKAPAATVEANRPRPPIGKRRSSPEQPRLRRDKVPDEDAAFTKDMMVMYAKLIGCDKSNKDAMATLVSDIFQRFQRNPRSLSSLAASPRISRLVQMCLKLGSVEQRRRFVTVLQGDFKELCASQGGHRLAAKLHRYSERAQKKAIFRFVEENGALLFSKYGSAVWEHVYNFETPRNKRQMINRVAVPRAVQAKHPDFNELTLKEFFANLDATEIVACKEAMDHLLQRLIDKELLAKAHVHDLVKSFLATLSEDEVAGWTSRFAEGFHHFSSTREGTEVLIRLLGHADAKQRKSFMKAIKGDILGMATNPCNFLLLCRLILIMDDTKLVGDYIVRPVTRNLKRVGADKNGRKVLMTILSRSNLRRHLTEQDYAALALPSPRSAKAGDKREAEVLAAFTPEACQRILTGEAPLALFLRDESLTPVLAALVRVSDAPTASAISAAAVVEAAKPEPNGVLVTLSGTVQKSCCCLLRARADGTTVLMPDGSSVAGALWSTLAATMPDDERLRDFLCGAAAAFLILDLLTAAAREGASWGVAMRERLLSVDIVSVIGQLSKDGRGTKGLEKLCVSLASG